MLNKLVLPPLENSATPPVAFHFLVVFFGIGPAPLPNPIDVRFQSVSGLGISLPSAGEVNMGSRAVRMPGAPKYSTLTLERGYIAGSILRKELELGMPSLQIFNKTILIMLMNGQNIPVANWLVFDAHVINWSAGNLDANQSQVLIERMEFAYSSFQSLSL